MAYSTEEYERKCERATANFVFQGDRNSQRMNRWNQGPKWLSPIFVEAGDKVTFTVILDPSSEDTVDWSFTAWGTDGPVSVTNKNSAITTDSYPT